MQKYRNFPIELDKESLLIIGLALIMIGLSIGAITLFSYEISKSAPNAADTVLITQYVSTKQ